MMGNVPLADLRSLAARIQKSAWFDKLAYPSFRLGVAKAKSSTLCSTNRAEAARLGEWDFNRLSLYHDLAHKLQPPKTALHGPEFCKLLLETVRRWEGVEAKRVLADEFRANRVKTRVYTPEGKEALAANASAARSVFVEQDLHALLGELKP